MKNSDKNSKILQPKKSISNFPEQAIDADKIKGGYGVDDDISVNIRHPKPKP